MTWFVTQIQIKNPECEGSVSYRGQAALGKAGFYRTTSGDRWERDCKSIWLGSSLFMILLLSSPKMPTSRVLTDSIWDWLTDEPSPLCKEGSEQVFPPQSGLFFLCYFHGLVFSKQGSIFRVSSKGHSGQISSKLSSLKEHISPCSLRGSGGLGWVP